MKLTQFYTYLYLRKNWTPYYVGKGQNSRAFSKQKNVRLPDRARVIVQHWGSEQEAFEMERWYIRLYGRKDNGTGILRNITDGGEGPSGAKRTSPHYAEHCRKMATEKIGKPSPLKGRKKGPAWNKGLKMDHSPEVLARMSRAGATPWNKGKTGIYSEEALVRIAASLSGYKHSDDARKNMSLAQLKRQQQLRSGVENEKQPAQLTTIGLLI